MTGPALVRGLLDEREIARLREGVEQNLGAPSERALEGGGGAGSGRFFEDFRNWTQDRAPTRRSSAAPGWGRPRRG